ncbi:hypothetical protein [Alicyclobacillus fodiniaquatilis]|uniref:Helix-turn-helix domain-containing protein n=1 Tax=Alicyclobacillus fodiniaquatilis TaxID=1661150 RepID=A0ABW4JCV0_9BACL
MSIKASYLASELVRVCGSWVETPSKEILEHVGTVEILEHVGTITDHLLTAANGVPTDIVEQIHEIPESTWYLAWEIFHEVTSGKLIPPLVGLAEVAEILDWDRRKVATYIKRGSLPEPIQRLRSGPIWTRKQIAEYQERIQK